MSNPKIGIDGEQRWYLNGRIHREDGPAIERADGSVIWFLNHQSLTFSDYCKQLNLPLEEQLVLALKYGSNP